MLLRPERMNINKLSSICRFQSYEESENGVEVTYTEAGEPKHIRCKLLVGADGYFSAVRQQCLEDGPPDFAVSPHLPSVPCMGRGLQGQILGGGSQACLHEGCK